MHNRFFHNNIKVQLRYLLKSIITTSVAQVTVLCIVVFTQDEFIISTEQILRDDISLSK